MLAYKDDFGGKSGIHHYLTGFEQAVRRGQAVARACLALRERGFVPDLVLAHPGWGESLFVKDVFPDCRLVNYFEFFYSAEGADVGFDPEYPPALDDRLKLRIKNSALLHALNDADAGISPTEWQRSRHPAAYRDKIEVIHEGFHTSAFEQVEDPRFSLPGGRMLDRGTKVVTYVARNLEPYRGFHVFMRALPALQRALPDAHFVIVGGDEVSYGAAPPKPFKSFREYMLAEVTDLDHGRLHFPGKLPYEGFLALMKVSTVHVYLTYPFVASWSLLEAMGCGCTVVASRTPPVEEFVRDGENGLLFDFFDTDAMVNAVCLAAGGTQAHLGSAARRFVADHFDFERHTLPRIEAFLGLSS